MSISCFLGVKIDKSYNFIMWRCPYHALCKLFLHVQNLQKKCSDRSQSLSVSCFVFCFICYVCPAVEAFDFQRKRFVLRENRWNQARKPRGGFSCICILSDAKVFYAKAKYWKRCRFTVARVSCEYPRSKGCARVWIKQKTCEDSGQGNSKSWRSNSRNGNLINHRILRCWCVL